MLDTGYWILDAGCWVLDAGYFWVISLRSLLSTAYCLPLSVIPDFIGVNGSHLKCLLLHLTDNSFCNLFSRYPKKIFHLKQI